MTTPKFKFIDVENKADHSLIDKLIASPVEWILLGLGFLVGGGAWVMFNLKVALRFVDHLEKKVAESSTYWLRYSNIESILVL